jgi:hypothetical protein
MAAKNPAAPPPTTMIRREFTGNRIAEVTLKVSPSFEAFVAIW